MISETKLATNDVLTEFNLFNSLRLLLYLFQ